MNFIRRPVSDPGFSSGRVSNTPSANNTISQFDICIQDIPVANFLARGRGCRKRIFALFSGSVLANAVPRIVESVIREGMNLSANVLIVRVEDVVCAQALDVVVVFGRAGCQDFEPGAKEVSMAVYYEIQL